jgi:hypothetical protein
VAPLDVGDAAFSYESVDVALVDVQDGGEVGDADQSRHGHLLVTPSVRLT